MTNPKRMTLTALVAAAALTISAAPASAQPVTGSLDDATVTQYAETGSLFNDAITDTSHPLHQLALGSALAIGAPLISVGCITGFACPQ